MLGFLSSRLLQTAVVLLAVSALVFAGVYVIGNPVDVMISPLATPEERLGVARALGLDQSLWVQYARFLGDALHADFGKSFMAGQPAMHLIFQRAPATLELAVAAMGLAALVGIPLGLLAAVRPEAWLSRAGMGFSIVGLSLPSFWIAIVLIMVLSVWAGVLPSSGRGETREMFGIQWSFLTADGCATSCCRRSRSRCPRSRCWRGSRAGRRWRSCRVSTSSSRAPRGCAPLASWACTCWAT